MACGGYEANFVDEPLEYFKCVVCQMVLRDPVLFVECGHRVCKTCLNQMKEHSTKTKNQLTCPYDRKPIDPTKVFEDKGISRTILDFRVKCERASSGCGWTGELRDLEKHLNSKCGCGGGLVQRVNECEEKLRQKDAEIDALKIQVQIMEDQMTQLQRQMLLFMNGPSSSSSPHRRRPYLATFAPPRSHSLPRSSRIMADVLFDFSGVGENELCVGAGERVMLVGEDDGSGWRRVNRGDEDGYIPTSYLQVLGSENAVGDAGVD